MIIKRKLLKLNLNSKSKELVKVQLVKKRVILKNIKYQQLSFNKMLIKIKKINN